MSEQTVKCPICGEPFVFYAHMAGDQSACPDCRAKARRKSRPTNTTNSAPRTVTDSAPFHWRRGRVRTTAW